MGKTFVLLKDIVIPAGTILHDSPEKMEFCDGSHKVATIGLSPNTAGTFVYSVDCDDDTEILGEYFTDLE